MALPKGDVTARESLFEILRANLCDKRMHIAQVLCPELVLYWLPVIADCRHDVGLQFVLADEEIPDAVVRAGLWHQRLECFPEPLHVLGSPWEVSHGRGEIEIKGVSSPDNLVGLDLGLHVHSFRKHGL